MSGRQVKFRRASDPLEIAKRTIAILEQRVKQQQQTIIIISAGLNRISHMIFVGREEVEKMRGKKAKDLKSFESRLQIYEEFLAVLTGAAEGSDQFEEIVKMGHEAVVIAKAKPKEGS